MIPGPPPVIMEKPARATGDDGHAAGQIEQLREAGEIHVPSSVCASGAA